MKTALASQITKALLLSFLATSFVACKTVEQGSDFSSRSPAATSLVSAKKSLHQAGSGSIQGPGDSGGGNGVGGKAYESYIVDVTKLPEFQLIAPILDKMVESNDNPKRKKTSAILADSKTWYIAPVTLKPIDKSILGVSFSKDDTEQLAIQTKNAIWIDQQKWIAMKEPKDRAMLLLHEITMELYLMRFEEFATNCSQYQFACPDLSRFNHDTAKSVRRRALTNDDYENIRAATFWLANNAKTSTSIQIQEKLGSLYFDSRFYGPKAVSQRKDGDNGENTVTYESGDAAATLTIAQVLNKMPDKCYAIHLGVHFDCTVTSLPAQAPGANGIKISVAGKNFSREALVVPEKGYSVKDDNWYGTFQMNLNGPSSCQIGSVSQFVTLYAFDEKSEQSSARDIFAMVIEPLVVFGSKGILVERAKPKATSLETDTILVYRSDMDIDVAFLASVAPRIDYSHTVCN